MAVVMADCAGCGKAFDNSTGVGFCVACDLEIRAREPSQLLKDLRWIYEGEAPQNDRQEKLKRIWETEPEKFLNRLEKGERDYRQQAARDRPATDSPSADESPGDEGAARASELLDRLLGEAGS